MRLCVRSSAYIMLMIPIASVYASPAVAETLKGEESHALAEVEIFVGKQVKVQIEPLYNQEQFDVVMM